MPLLPLNSKVKNYVGLLRQVHRDNSVWKHFAEDTDGNLRSTMFLTPFAYQFFLYNSLYQIDWPTSIASGEIKNLSYDRDREKRSQAAFEEFLEQHSGTNPHAVGEAFTDVEAFPINAPWARVTPDAQISVEQGAKFFKDLRAFQAAIRALRKSHDPSDVPAVFSYIRELRPFIYDVRCNIFHGRKSLADALESNQNKRIEVYFRFLNGLVTLFFKLLDSA